METSTTNGSDTDIGALREKVSRLEALIDLPPEIPLEKAPTYRTLWEAFTDAVALNKKLQMRIEAYTYRSGGTKKQLAGRIVQLEAEVFDLQRELEERDERIKELEDLKAKA